MKYLKRFNESSEDDWDLEEISDIFQDILDEGFRIEDVHIGSSLSIAPKLWCNSHHDFTGNTFPSLTIKFVSVNDLYNYEILDILDECINHFESYYKVKLESIYTVGLPTTEYSSSGSRRTVIYNWFNSCETIKDIAKVHSKITYQSELKKISTSDRITPHTKERFLNLVNKLPLTRFDLTFDLTK